MQDPIRLPLDEAEPPLLGVAGASAKERRPINVADAYSDERFERSTETDGYRTRSMLAMPFERASSGELMGVCQLTNKQAQGEGTTDGVSFDAADELLLATLLKLVALTVDSQR